MAGQHWWVGGLTSVRSEDAKSDSSLNDNRINYRGDTVLDHEIVCRRLAQSELKLHERLPTTCIAVRCGAFSPDGFNVYVESTKTEILFCIDTAHR
jgi:hypothetical protein